MKLRAYLIGLATGAVLTYIVMLLLLKFGGLSFKVTKIMMPQLIGEENSFSSPTADNFARIELHGTTAIITFSNLELVVPEPLSEPTRPSEQQGPL